MNEINKTEMRAWRDALRKAHKDGVRQTTGVLYRTEGTHTPEGFCCLGIRMEAAADAGRVDREKYGMVMYYREPSKGTEDIRESEALTPRETELLGLSSADPILLSVPHPLTSGAHLNDRNAETLNRSASWLNDNAHLNFDQIADCMTWTYNLDGEDD